MESNYQELEFVHFVVDNSDGTVFGAARVNGSGRITTFLISDAVKEQAGEQWQELDPDVANIIRDRALAAYGRVPTYRTKRLLL